jgi:hypothetical protein
MKRTKNDPFSCFFLIALRVWINYGCFVKASQHTQKQLVLHAIENCYAHIMHQSVTHVVHHALVHDMLPLVSYRFIAVAILFRTFLWTHSARPQKCPCPNRSGGCYNLKLRRFNPRLSPSPLPREQGVLVWRSFIKDWC